MSAQPGSGSIALPTVDRDPTSSGGPRSHRTRLSRLSGSLVGVIAFIAFLHVLGWGTLIAIVAPQHLNIGTAAFGIGIGLTAYMLGIRHAFDADHIAAIDNTTRKLMHEGKQPTSVGFWFSFGHSSVVFALTLLLAFGIGAIAGPVQDDRSEFHNVARLVGTVVSSCFLYAIAALNLMVLLNVWKAFRTARNGGHDEAFLEGKFDSRGGLISRLLGRLQKVVTEPWQMYIVGLLFGLGFDTASEIAFLVLTGSGAASGVPWYAILCLPILFAAGMSLFDTLDGSLMTVAYEWALTNPARKIFYNLVVTGLSVAIALGIGTVEIVGLLDVRLNLSRALKNWVAALDPSAMGLAVVGLFIATWAIAFAISNCRRPDVALTFLSNSAVGTAWLVDDNKSVRDSTGAFLEAMGWAVQTYESALDFLHKFDLGWSGCVIADYDMPGMTGLELLETLRRRGSRLPVIIITGRGDAMLEQRVLEAGGFRMLHKPIDGLELADLAEKAMAEAA